MKHLSPTILIKNGDAPAHATPPPSEAQVPTGTGPETVLRGLRDNQRLAARVLMEIEAALSATTAIWDAPSKTFIDRPDFKTRLQACELYLAHTVGLPVQRSENLNVNAHAPASDAISPEAQFMSSPTLRQAARHLLDRAERRAAEAVSTKAG
jgi:hypothetical protein